MFRILHCSEKHDFPMNAVWVITGSELWGFRSGCWICSSAVETEPSAHTVLHVESTRAHGCVSARTDAPSASAAACLLLPGVLTS